MLSIIKKLLSIGPSYGERQLANHHTVADLLTVVEVDDATNLAGDLFQRSFNAAIPDFPRHFIVRYKAGNQPVVGYIHYTPASEVYLCGGMCIDAYAYKRMPKEHRARISAIGGITELMLRQTFAVLTDRDAIFGYCGDIKAMRVDLRAGFTRTPYPYLIVKWREELSEDRKQYLLKEIYKIGPF